jgi:hypothetical protein
MYIEVRFHMCGCEKVWKCSHLWSHWCCVGFINVVGVFAGVRRQRLVCLLGNLSRFHLKAEIIQSQKRCIFK